VSRVILLHDISSAANVIPSLDKCAYFVPVTSSSAIAEWPRCRVGYLWQKVEDWNWETIFYGHYRSICNHCDEIGQQSNRIR